jgi:hypothetical protein
MAMTDRRKRAYVGKVKIEVRGRHPRAFLQIELELSANLRRNLVRQLEAPMKKSK